MSRRIWTKDKCLVFAKKCITRTEMLKRFPRAYDAAVTHKWLNSIFSKHLNKGFDQRKKKQGYWTNERLVAVASRCTDRLDFAKRYSGAYSVAFQKKLMNQLFANHKNQGYQTARLSKDHWKIKKNCEEAAKQCKTRSEFCKRFKAAYRSANRNGWYEEICSHMKIRGNRLNRFVYELVDEEKKEVYVGLTHDVQERLANHRANGRKEIKQMLRRQCKIVTSPLPIPARQAQLEEARLIQVWRDKGYIVWNAVRAGALGASDRYWTFDRCLKVAKECKDREEMRRLHNGAIQTAVKFKWLDKIFENHPNKGFRHKPHGYWTLELIKSLAKPYRSRGDFQKAEPIAYNRAHQRGWLDEIFKDHKKRGYISAEKNHWNLSNCKLAAEQAKTRSVFYKKYPGAAKKAAESGWIEKIFKTLPNQGFTRTPTNYWSFEKLLKESKRYKTKADFKRKNPSAYNRAVRTNQLDELFANHENAGLKYKPDGYWTIKRSLVEARKFSSKMELKRNAQGAYHCLRVAGLLETAFYTGRKRRK